MVKRWLSVACFSIFCIVGMTLSSVPCTAALKEAVRAEYVMGTILEISILTGNNRGKNALDAAFDEVRRLDRVMSSYREESEISRLNGKGSTGWIKVSRDVYTVIEESIRFSRMTAGAFDITIGPITRTWGFRKEGVGGPLEKELAQLLPLVNYRNIRLNKRDRSIRFLRKGMELDLGGIGKGYAIARVIYTLKVFGIERGRVNFGGSLFFMAAAGSGMEWRVGVRDPEEEGKSLLTLTVRGGAVSTSGGYERFKTIDGKKYSHIINPGTGLPGGEIASATVFSADPVMADALSTAISVMTPAKGMELVNSLDGVEAVIVAVGENGGKKRSILLSRGLL